MKNHLVSLFSMTNPFHYTLGQYLRDKKRAIRILNHFTTKRYKVKPNFITKKLDIVL